MAKQSTKKDNSTLAGLIGFGATLLLYALIFSLHTPLDFIIGGGLSALAGWVVKTMATPLKGLDKSSKSKDALNVTIIEDEYARGIVEKGVEMLDALKTERDAINEYVFTRRINDMRGLLDKVLRNVIEDPQEARYLRKINSYYLPTTLKLLQSYRSAKAQGTSYMTISQTREDILGMLDKLNEALQTTLDTMIRNDLEDMDIEIDVFDQMLKADGLTADEVTEHLRQSAHAAAKAMPVSQAPAVKPAAPVQMPQPTAKPAAKPAPTLQPVKEPEHKPQAVTMDSPAPANAREYTPVPTLQVPAGTASARQLQQGAPVLTVPEAPASPDYSDAIQHENKA